MQSIEVTARFDNRGEPTPLSFIWKGVFYQIDGIGRCWQDDTGMHMLTMISDGRIFELIYVKAGGKWYMGGLSKGRKYI